MTVSRGETLNGGWIRCFFDRRSVVIVVETVMFQTQEKCGSAAENRSSNNNRVKVPC
jgi:hypothetical protein